MTDVLPTIRRLPPDLRDQIAAGEVVERPASVVKELVENALDAGARTIRVEIEGGGLDRIAVVDDGHGMLREGVLLAVERHATSKLERFDDLYRLSTFGFRGEALPSIAAVSRTTVTTRPASEVEAVECTVVGGAPAEVRVVGAPAGTTVEVRDLFFNVPARRKFLKSVGTESGHVADACVDLALARPDLALTLVRDKRVARQWLRAPDREARGRDVLARTLDTGGAAELAHVVAERPGLCVEALLSPPERARSGATGLHFLVNGRAVRDRQLARAVAMAYGSVLDPGRYPLGIVWIDVPSEDVDVNVHPQKAEVRFARGRELYDDVTRAVGSKLADSFRGPVSSSFFASRAVSHLFPAPKTDRELPEASAIVGDGTHALSQAMAHAFAPRPASDDADPWGLSGSLPMPVPPETRVAPRASTERPDARPASGDDREQASRNVAAFAAARADLASTLVSADVLRPVAAAPAARGEPGYAALRFLAQVRSTYLICEGPDGIYVLDQHAAAERVNFARLRDAFQRRAIARQQLLVPEVVQVRVAEASLVDEARDELLAIGVDARTIGDGRVAIHGVPALLARRAPESVLRDVLDELAKTGERKFGDAIDLVLATMACHGSVRAGDTLHRDECEALLRDLDTIDFAGYCPHGRPIVTVLSYVDLEKKVGRR